MKRPLLGRPVSSPGQATQGAGERGVTIALVALAIVAIMAMAALSVDVVTLYLANAEAQRSADAAALAAARILSISGMTGDPANSGGHWANACTAAAQVATAVAKQNRVGSAAGIVTVSFPNNSDTTACTGTTAAFGVNPLVTVQVQRTNLPTFFARIWGHRGATVGATATAEAFNSANSGSVNAGSAGTVIPVQPRCVKPLIVPNFDPGNAGICTGPGSCNLLVNNSNGSISNPGIMVNNAGAGVIGRTFNLFAGCSNNNEPCVAIPPVANYGGTVEGSLVPVTTPNLEYFPGDVPSTSTAVPSCATATAYEEAVGGCDQNTIYQCGVPSASAASPNTIELAENPGGVSGDTSTAVQCLVHQKTINLVDGQDVLDTSAYPYKIKAGTANPLGVAGSTVITSSNSIVSLPIYDSSVPLTFTGTQADVTIVGFLQVFINQVNSDGSVNVTIINVTGCGNGTNPTGTAITGTSSVPVRLITYP